MPKQVDHEQRRDDIARAACHVIAGKGYAQTTLADIARQAGCTTGALRHYFETKDDILNAATDYSRFHSRKRLRRVSRREPYSLIDTLLETLPTNAEQHIFIKVWMETNVRSMGSEYLSQESAASARDWTRLIKAELKKAQTHGQVSPQCDTEVEGEVLVLALIGLITRVVVDPDHWPVQKQKAVLESLVSRLQ